MTSKSKLVQVLLSPIVSEKSTMLAEKNNQVSFRVHPEATKAEVKKAVETLFSVKVCDVKVVNIKGKEGRFGRYAGKQNDVRKAYVTLEKGQDINFAEVK